MIFPLILYLYREGLVWTRINWTPSTTATGA